MIFMLEFTIHTQLAEFSGLKKEQWICYFPFLEYFDKPPISASIIYMGNPNDGSRGSRNAPYSCVPVSVVEGMSICTSSIGILCTMFYYLNISYSPPSFCLFLSK